MATASSSKVWTWEEVLELPGGDRYEVIDGELKARIMSFRSSEIAILIAALLVTWSRSGHPGTVTGSDGGYTIFSWAPGDVRMPDVSYISRTRLPKSPPRGWVDVAPEFAVEVVSPTDRIADAEDKAQDYIRAGVDLVWVVVPSTKSVHIWRADGSRSVVQSGATLTGEAVLPGFSVPVDSLFDEAE
ncbi:MAG: Uma2 family endonuclease [Dehalococcoidia bacterium]